MKKIISAFLLAAITLGFVAQARAVCALSMQPKIDINANTSPAPVSVDKTKRDASNADQGIAN